MAQGEPQPQQPESQLQSEQQSRPQQWSRSEWQQSGWQPQPQAQPGWQPESEWGPESDWQPESQPEYEWPSESAWRPVPEHEPYEEQSKSHGCMWVIIVALVVVVAVLAARATGVVDHLQYVLSGTQEFGAEAVDQELESAVEAELQGRYYAYSTLSAEEQRCYRIMFDALSTREPREYPEDGADSISKIRACIVADHPELFYVDGVTFRTTYNQVTELVSDVTIEGSFSCDTEEAAARQAQSDVVAQAFLATVPQDADDYTKAKLAYEFIAQQASYDHAAAYSINTWAENQGRASGQTMDDVFVDGLAVCAGYSAAYQYLLQHMGIQCVQVRGTAEGVGHAWCIARLDGAYYQIDPTWGDPQFMDESVSVGDDYVNYDFLAVTDSDISSTHVVDDSFVVPACTAADDNYYVREGLLFEGADATRLGQLVSEAESAGASAVQIRCTNDEAYFWLLQGFVATGDLGYSLSDREYRYTNFDAMRSITIFP